MNAVSGTSTLEDDDRKYLIHPFTNLKEYASGQSARPVVYESGDGLYVRDRDGNQYLDAFAGLYCVNVGYGRTEIARAIYEQATKLAYYHAYAGATNEPAIRLAEKILSLAPTGMKRIFFGLSGSDANESLVKIAWYYNNVLGRPHKKKIISRNRAYHGATIFSGSLTGLPVFHTAFDLPLTRVLHTRTPHYYWQSEGATSEGEFSQRCALELEALILREGADTIAAFIGEPVLGTGGLIPPPQGYWSEIQPVLKKHDVLLIVDEVICGFGRVGTPFGSHLYDIRPDMMTIAKGLTSGYLPLSGSLVSEEVSSVLDRGSDVYGPFAHGLTYSAHPLAAAAALANINILEREHLIENARDMGLYLQRALHQDLSAHQHVGEIRGVGLLAAVEFVEDRVAKRPFETARRIGARLAAACLSQGVICRAMPHGDILGFAPPLTIDTQHIDRIVDVVGKAVRSVLGPG
jgi:L-2,4-diaminobutyrate transaminase